MQKFMDLGWWTVPLKGSLKRDENGKKNAPHFSAGWKAAALETKNVTSSTLGGVMTGPESGIVAVDCDNENTYNLFKALDPDYPFVFVSKGKGYPSGTFIYSYEESLDRNFSINDSGIALDFFSTKGFVYLPTKANKTKEFMPEVPKLKEMPSSVKLLLLQFAKKTTPKTAASTDSSNRGTLATLVRQFTDNDGKFIAGLFRAITPVDFRSEEQYVKSGYLHPKNIPDGRGSEYLSKVSAILGADRSIDTQLYSDCMHCINDLWPSPMDETKMELTVTSPMLEGKASVNGEVIWTYDPDWEKDNVSLATKAGQVLETGYDSLNRSYYAVNQLEQTFTAIDSEGEFFSHLKACIRGLPKKATLIESMPLIQVESRPQDEFGFTDGGIMKVLNTFVQSPELKILNDPDSYTEFYKRPESTIAYFEGLIPEDAMRNYFLGFMKRKFTTFEYSPVVLYLLGVPGSGKDTFVNILETMIHGIHRPKIKQFLEKHNKWVVGSYIVQLDEYGDKMSRSIAEEVLGIIKSISGSAKIEVRVMNRDAYLYRHHITIVVTANRNRFILEFNDRRFAIAETPNKLATMKWVVKIGGLTKAIHAIQNESKDFAYYLATEVKSLTADEYQNPPSNDNKKRIIAVSLGAQDRILFLIVNQMWDELIDLSYEYGGNIDKEIENRFLTEASIEALYAGLTEGVGDIARLNKQARLLGIKLGRQGDINYYDVFNKDN